MYVYIYIYITFHTISFSTFQWRECSPGQIASGTAREYAMAPATAAPRPKPLPVRSNRQRLQFLQLLTVFQGGVTFGSRVVPRGNTLWRQLRPSRVRNPNRSVPTANGSNSRNF